MAKKVIIAEKPSVAKEFAKALKINVVNKNGYMESSDYIVTWCVGHLVTMSYPEKYDEKMKYWNLSTLPFIPKEFKYEVIDNVKKQFDIVSNILNREDVDLIYVCTDSGREGEYIYRLVDEMAGSPKKEKRRVWIDSQTEEAILNGIKEAKLLDEYNSLSDAAYLRAKEDYLIGINFSRLLSLLYAKRLAKTMGEERAVISIGRVMTCVLGLIVNRENEIRNFKKVNFYKIQGDFFKSEENVFKGDFKVTNTSSVYDSIKLYNDTGFKKKQDAQDFIEYLSKNKIGKIENITKKKSKENPPLLFNLAEVQNECTKNFKISPDETLQIIQNLYEKKLVTYPRTDARVLSSAVAKIISKNLNGLAKMKINDEIDKIIDKMVKEKYSIKLEKTKYVDDSKITDHYAIIPTGQGKENIDKLTSLEKEVYFLIVKRFLAIFYPPAIYNRISITIDISGEKFFTNAKVCEELGYLEIYKNDKKVEKEDTEEKDNKDDDQILTNSDILANLRKNDVINIKGFNIKTGETTPPKRYSSGSMILAMENAGKLIEDEELREQIKGSGIGTSATRAEIIKKLEKIDYIATNKKTQILTPTKRGESVYEIVSNTMPDLLNPELTASWEKGLTMVAQKEISADEFMKKLEEYIRNKVVKFKKSRNQYLYGY